MGKYIEKLDGIKLPTKGKAQFLIMNANAIVIPEPTTFKKDLVVVANNGGFDVAAYAFDEQEFIRFSRPDERQKIWLIVPKVESYL